MPGPSVVCFGEVLWDCLPKGLFAGGAPINVAYHLRQFGLDAFPVTAVGRDFLGDEILRRFRHWNLSPKFVDRVDKLTGAVIAELDAAGVATYKFLEDVAWDYVTVSEELEQFATSAKAIVFGTLAQRSKVNVEQLASLRRTACNAVQVYDVNLRPPYDSRELVWGLAKGCELIKLNDEELRQLLEVADAGAGLDALARKFSEHTNCPRICVTAGKRGAGLLWEGQWHWEPPQPITIKDTVGAGDSFLAAFLHGWLVAGLSAAENLKRASRVAEFVATCDGATPAYRLNEQGLPVRG